MHQLLRPTAYRKHHKLSELMEMQSCKVTAKSTFLFSNEGHLLNRQLEYHLIELVA